MGCLVQWLHYLPLLHKHGHAQQRRQHGRVTGRGRGLWRQPRSSWVFSLSHHREVVTSLSRNSPSALFSATKATPQTSLPTTLVKVSIPPSRCCEGKPVLSLHVPHIRFEITQQASVSPSLCLRLCNVTRNNNSRRVGRLVFMQLLPSLCFHITTARTLYRYMVCFFVFLQLRTPDRCSVILGAQWNDHVTAINGSFWSKLIYLYTSGQK